MRSTYEYKIRNSPYNSLKFVPIPEHKGYQIFIDGDLRYQGRAFSFDECNAKLEQFRAAGVIIDITPIITDLEGDVLPPKRKRRTKREMQEAKRIQFKEREVKKTMANTKKKPARKAKKTSTKSTKK